MRPIKLMIEGLNSFIEKQTIDFEDLTSEGFFGIFGPTGSGKSSILDGITLALYGNIARKTAPIALDLVLFSDLAMRAGMCGIQTWLSFFCKSPMHDFEHQPEHDLFTQWRMVKQTLRNMIGEKEPDYLA